MINKKRRPVWRGKSLYIFILGMCFVNIAAAWQAPSPTRQEVSLAGEWQYLALTDDKVKYGQPNEILIWLTAEHDAKTDTVVAYSDRVAVLQQFRLAAYPPVFVEDVYIKSSVRQGELAADFTLVNRR